MGVLIKGMDMTSGCWLCRFCDYEEGHFDEWRGVDE